MTLQTYSAASLQREGWTKAEAEGFAAMMERADAFCRRIAGGLGVEDFADAAWADLFTDTDGEATEADFGDTLCDADGLFRAFAGAEA